MKNIKPLKRYGQNFLIDKNIISNIIDEFNPGRDEKIVEIGPGQGALTEYLFLNKNNFAAIEIDKRSIEILESKYPGINIINKDFVKLDLSEIASEISKIRIIGNIPYNITTDIINKLIANRRLITDVVMMVQDEVAKRFLAKKRTKDYGAIAVLLQYFTEIKYCFYVSPNVFKPKPRVSSAIIHLFFKEMDNNVDSELFIKLVKASFQSRRKTLKNSLSNSIFGDCDFENIDFDLTRRAEELTIDEFTTLTNIFENLLYAGKGKI